MIRKCLGLSQHDTITLYYFLFFLLFLFLFQLGSLFFDYKMRKEEAVTVVFFILEMLVIYTIGFIAGIVMARSDVTVYENDVVRRWCERQDGSLVNHSAYGTFPVAVPSKEGGVTVSC